MKKGHDRRSDLQRGDSNHFVPDAQQPIRELDCHCEQPFPRASSCEMRDSKRLRPNYVIAHSLYRFFQFVGYAKDTAAAKGVSYVDHFAVSASAGMLLDISAELTNTFHQAVISAYTTLGKATVDAYFPNDHTHTNTAGATTVAAAWISGLKCTAAKSVLSTHYSTTGASLPSRC